MNESAEDPKEGEVLPKHAPTPPSDEGNWLALISNYTERPDLFLAEVEKHDPGFTKRMNEASAKRAETQDTARFHFGKNQAYTALGISAIAAVTLLGILGIAVWKEAGFWTIIGLAIFYAISQGGSMGISAVVSAVSEFISRIRRPAGDDN